MMAEIAIPTSTVSPLASSPTTAAEPKWTTFHPDSPTPHDPESSTVCNVEPESYWSPSTNADNHSARGGIEDGMEINPADDGGDGEKMAMAFEDRFSVYLLQPFPSVPTPSINPGPVGGQETSPIMSTSPPFSIVASGTGNRSVSTRPPNYDWDSSPIIPQSFDPRSPPPPPPASAVIKTSSSPNSRRGSISTTRVRANPKTRPRAYSVSSPPPLPVSARSNRFSPRSPAGSGVRRRRAGTVSGSRYNRSRSNSIISPPPLPSAFGQGHHSTYLIIQSPPLSHRHPRHPTSPSVVIPTSRTRTKSQPQHPTTSVKTKKKATAITKKSKSGRRGPLTREEMLAQAIALDEFFGISAEQSKANRCGYGEVRVGRGGWKGDGGFESLLKKGGDEDGGYVTDVEGGRKGMDRDRKRRPPPLKLKVSNQSSSSAVVVSAAFSASSSVPSGFGAAGPSSAARILVVRSPMTRMNMRNLAERRGGRVMSRRDVKLVSPRKKKPTKDACYGRAGEGVNRAPVSDERSYSPSSLMSTCSSPANTGNGPRAPEVHPEYPLAEVLKTRHEEMQRSRVEEAGPTKRGEVDGDARAGSGGGVTVKALFLRPMKSISRLRGLVR